MEKDFHREFTKCPQCGSEDRFLEELGKELKERGVAREEWNMHLDVKEGHVVDEAKEAAIPIGSDVPAFGIITDICMNCGCIYASVLQRRDAKKGLPPAQPIPSNRAQRRRMGKEPLINPFSPS